MENYTGQVVNYLIENKITIATAESCTSGMIAAAIGDVSGVSSVFSEGFVTYSNEAKEKILGVPHTLLEERGAVSHEVCRAMAEGVCAVTGADIGVSATGIAGPTGGTDEKPVGLVYIGICIKGSTTVFKYRFSGSRYGVRYRTVLCVFDQLKNLLKI